MTGRLVLVGTPIGNLGDLTPRAVETLANASLIACEDTRRTGRLLQLAGIDKRPLLTVNEHTEFDAIDRVLGEVETGATVALVSDAGMPGVSDPGERLVAAAAERGLVVEVVPGPSAVLAGLVLSGLPAQRFCFEGFLPRKGAERGQRIVALVAETRTSVLFEAPHRVERTLADLAEACGAQRRVAIARELTKMHEQVWRGTLADAVEWVGDHTMGEFVLILEGAEPASEATDTELSDALAEQLDAGATGRDAVDSVSESFGVNRNRVYELMLARRKSE